MAARGGGEGGGALEARPTPLPLVPPDRGLGSLRSAAPLGIGPGCRRDGSGRGQSAGGACRAGSGADAAVLQELAPYYVEALEPLMGMNDTLKHFYSIAGEFLLTQTDSWAARNCNDGSGWRIRPFRKAPIGIAVVNCTPRKHQEQ